ncbi:hypothetical protein [Streptomyces sp. NPDC127190]|uniref:hypothetical protein n=1 Tax=unclassified Streptomyces TaxID=2593676 RepID=UPI003636D038
MDSGAIRRRLALGATVLAASGALALAVPATAQASGGGSCAGHEVRTLSFRTGAVHIYRHNAFVCAVTIPKSVGARRPMSVSIQARGSRPVIDKGTFRYQAGPVTVHAGHRCVWVTGAVAGQGASSGWILC